MTLSLRYQQQPPSDILPVLTTSSTITNALSNFQIAYLEGLSNVRQYFQQLNRDRQRQIEMTSELCQLMDQQLAVAAGKRKERALRRAERTMVRACQINETERSVGEGRILRSKSAKDSNKRQANSATKSTVKIGKAEQTNRGEVANKQGKKSSDKNESNRTLKRDLQVTQKRGSEAENIQIHICFKCLKNNQLAIWGSPEPFLAHMRQTHSMQPDFQLVLSAGNQQLPCSHLFFHGKLTSILKNSDNELYKKVLWMLVEGRTDSLIACGCLTFLNQNYGNYGCPLFLSAQEYITHLNRQHGMILPSGSTHRTVSSKGTMRVIRIAEADRIFSSSAMSNVKEELRIRILKESCLTFKRILSPSSKLTMLELLARSSFQQPHCEIYQPLPICDHCELTFPNLAMARAHCKDGKECKPKSAAVKSDYTLQDMRNYLKMEGKYYEELTEEWMADMPIEERRLLNLQLYLLRKFYHCGECDKWFTGRDKELRFLLHLSSHMETNPPCASFTFAFLLPQPTPA